MKLSCSAKKKQPPPDPSPEAGLAGGLAGGLEAGVEAGPRGRPRGGPRGTGRQTLQNLPNLNPLQNPPNTFPNRHPRAKATSQSGPQGQGHSNGFLLAFKAAVCQPANTPNAPKPSKHHPKPPNSPGLEACFEQVAQGLWLVRRVHQRSKAISLPGRLELPTLRLTASRSNQLSYGSLCRRPKLVPVLEKRLNNSWLQMVCQTKGQQPK